MTDQQRSVPELLDLTGRVAVVTGGAGLYGRHICAALAEIGAHVVVASRDSARGSHLADQLLTTGLSVSAEPLDLAHETSIVNLRNRVIEKHGTIDVLVNNAVHRQGGAIDTTTAEDWRSTSEVNSLGLFLMCKHIGAHMVERGRGVIVNVGSIYGLVGPDFSLYDGTEMTSPISYSYDKGGLVAMTRHLASWYAPHGVRVNSVSPGGLRADDQPASFVEAYERRVPLGRLAGPEDIKGPIAFLATDASKYVTGIDLRVDGGWTAI